jgi:hypothetical protein
MEKPKTSRQLKLLILAKEEEVRKDREIIQEYFRPTKIHKQPFGMLKGWLNQLPLTPSLKTEIIKTVIGFIGGFVAKKWLAPKIVETNTTIAHKQLETAIQKTVDNTEGMDLAEREMFKKLLHQYFTSQ